MLAKAWGGGELERVRGLRCLGSDGSSGVRRRVVEQHVRLESSEVCGAGLRAESCGRQGRE
eukprot:2544887-Pyramimonas_sp.AAC.1